MDTMPMRYARIHNRSAGDIRRHDRRRHAFTLVELIVSIGILSILLVMAGAVFSLTLRSSGQANALIEVSQFVRVFEQTLREDLRYVEPRKSMLVIQGNEINAYWTQDIKEAEEGLDGDPRTSVPGLRDPEREYYDTSKAPPQLLVEKPRADMLMFFTARPSNSYRDPDLTGRLQHVVYGHAEVGKLNRTTGAWQVGQDPTASSLLYTTYADATYDPNDPDTLPARSYPRPAEQWHLARRSTLILDQPLPTGLYWPAHSLDDSNAVLSTTNDDQPRYSVLGAENWLRDGRRDYIVNAAPSTILTNGDCWDTFNYTQCVERIYLNGNPRNAVRLDGASVYATKAHDWVLPWMQRSLMDPSPPSTQSSRLGHYLLSNCASFKVEWLLSFDDSSLSDCLSEFGEPFWVDPANVQAAYDRLDAMATYLATHRPECVQPLHDIMEALDPTDINTRFYNAGLGGVGTNDAFFAFDVAKGPDIDLPDPLFPKALRVTIDVFDPAGRLEHPIRHVMILPIGED